MQDSIRGCTSCASIPISSFLGKTVSHTLKVKFGSSGTLSYKAVDVASKKTLLSYNAKGQMGSKASLKAGAYRAVTSESWLGRLIGTSHLGVPSAQELTSP